MSKIEELKAKKIALTAKIAEAEKAQKQQQQQKEATAKAHLKNVFGGLCLAIFKDPEVPKTFKVFLLKTAEKSVTKNAENLARITFEKLKLEVN